MSRGGLIINRVVVLGFVYVLIIPTGSMGSTPDSQFHYHYFKEKIPLAEEGSSLAVFEEAPARPEEVADLLEAAGSPSSEAYNFPVRGWTIARLRTASSTPQVSNAPSIITRLAELDQPSRYFFSPIFANRDGGMLIITPTVLVRFERSVTAPRIRQILVSAGAPNAKMSRFGGMENAFKAVPQVRSGLDLLEIANRLAQLPGVVFAEPNMIMSGRSASAAPALDILKLTPLIPDDPEFPSCWGLNNTGQFSGSIPDVDIDAPEAWAITTSRPDVIIAVIDVGVDQGHLDINQISGNDFTYEPGALRDGGPVNDCDNHGTAVAGVISAKINNSLGTVGVAPGASVASARTFKSLPDCSGDWFAEFSWSVDALQWAESIGAKITNNSNTYESWSSAITSKYQDTRNKGLIHFASAGNDGEPIVDYPAFLPSVNAISAIGWDGALTSISNTGPEISLAAPGNAIFTADRSGQAGYTIDDITIRAGTSFAAGMAAGTAALLIDRNRNLTPDNVEMILWNSAIDLGLPGRDDSFGRGLTNAADALKIIALQLFVDGFETGDASRWSAEESSSSKLTRQPE